MELVILIKKKEIFLITLYIKLNAHSTIGDQCLSIVIWFINKILDCVLYIKKSVDKLIGLFIIIISLIKIS